MRPYEMLTIFHPDIEEHTEAAAEIEEVVRNLGGEPGKTDHWGKRKLAYPIDKIEEGRYVLFNFSIDPVQIKELDRLLKLKTSVVRHLVISKEDK